MVDSFLAQLAGVPLRRQPRLLCPVDALCVCLCWWAPDPSRIGTPRPSSRPELRELSRRSAPSPRSCANQRKLDNGLGGRARDPARDETQRSWLSVDEAICPNQFLGGRWLRQFVDGQQRSQFDYHAFSRWSITLSIWQKVNRPGLDNCLAAP